MFVFKKAQTSFKIDNITFGGNPGVFPTILIGGLFFKGQDVVENTRKGTFDKNLALEWINTALSMSYETGHPLVLQVYGRTEEAIENHISWVSDNFEGPFIFESINPKARIRGLAYCRESGLSSRTIFNSINISTTDAEKEAIQNVSLETAIALGWSPKATSLEERMQTIKEVVETTSNLGIDNIIVDPGTMPVGAGYGLELRTLLAMKSNLGLPSCIAPHNAPSAWNFIKRDEFNQESLHTSAVVASTVAAQLFTADSIMFGSLVRSKDVFTAVALIGNAISAAIAEAYHSLDMDRELFEPKTFQ
jgi:tetrahydromethanopterin S-methyltransferase subunit H